MIVINLTVVKSGLEPFDCLLITNLLSYNTSNSHRVINMNVGLRNYTSWCYVNRARVVVFGMFLRVWVLELWRSKTWVEFEALSYVWVWPIKSHVNQDWVFHELSNPDYAWMFDQCKPNRWTLLIWFLLNFVRCSDMVAAVLWLQ